MQGDIRDGERVAAAVAGVEVVIHAATSPRHGARKVEVDGARNVVKASTEAGAHLVYVSIVGVDQHRFPYYKAKWQAEQVIKGSRCRWTIQRATQFHDLLDMFLGMAVFIRTPHLAFQVIDAGEVARRLVALAEGPPQGRVADFGGPEVVPIQTLVETRRIVTGRRARLVRVPRVGFLRDFDDGKHLCPDHREGHISWGHWLRDSAAAR
jgi:uncharacterized protein YbjT (DUF2867 family)